MRVAWRSALWRQSGRARASLRTSLALDYSSSSVPTPVRCDGGAEGAGRGPGGAHGLRVERIASRRRRSGPWRRLSRQAVSLHILGRPTSSASCRARATMAAARAASRGEVAHRGCGGQPPGQHAGGRQARPSAMPSITPQRLLKIVETMPTPGAVSATFVPRFENVARNTSRPSSACPPRWRPRCRACDGAVGPAAVEPDGRDRHRARDSAPGSPPGRGRRCPRPPRTHPSCRAWSTASRMAPIGRAAAEAQVDQVAAVDRGLLDRGADRERGRVAGAVRRTRGRPAAWPTAASPRRQPLARDGDHAGHVRAVAVPVAQAARRFPGGVAAAGDRAAARGGPRRCRPRRP